MYIKKSSLNAAHTTVVECSPPTCHFYFILKRVEVTKELWEDSTNCTTPKVWAKAQKPDR